MDIEVSQTGLDAIIRGFAQAPQIVEQEMLASMTAATLHLEGKVKDAWPGLNQGRRPVSVWNSREQIRSDAFSTPAGVLGVVGTPSPYAPVIEFGRKPGKGVSEEGQASIALWARANLGVAENEAKSVAFLIARKIKARGLQARHVFETVLDANNDQINAEFESAAGRIAQRLEGSGA